MTISLALAHMDILVSRHAYQSGALTKWFFRVTFIFSVTVRVGLQDHDHIRLMSCLLALRWKWEAVVKSHLINPLENLAAFKCLEKKITN